MSEAELPISEIVVDHGVQQRHMMNTTIVEDYVEALERGDEFPPVVVYVDPDGKHWLADGFHRIEAHRKNRRRKIVCRVEQGDQNDAALYAATKANRAHGLRMTRTDKRKAVATVLRLKPDWSNRDVAKAVGVSHTFVNNIHQESVEPEPLPITESGNVSTPVTEALTEAVKDADDIYPKGQPFNMREQCGLLRALAVGIVKRCEEQDLNALTVTLQECLKLTEIPQPVVVDAEKRIE